MSPSGLMEAMWLDSRVLSFCLYTACTLRHLNTLQAFSRAPNKEVFTSAFAWGHFHLVSSRETSTEKEKATLKRSQDKITQLRAADDSDGFMLGLLWLP